MSENLLHTFGPHSDMCLHCGVELAWFNRNANEVCPKRLPEPKLIDQAKALATVPLPSKKHQLDQLIRYYMDKYFGWSGTGEWVDKPYEASDWDSDGCATGPGQWRALRRFAAEAAEILKGEDNGKTR